MIVEDKQFWEGQTVMPHLKNLNQLNLYLPKLEISKFGLRFRKGQLESNRNIVEGLTGLRTLKSNI